eukprot:3404682-Pyramimonas_sp.AAC.1
MSAKQRSAAHWAVCFRFPGALLPSADSDAASPIGPLTQLARLAFPRWVRSSGTWRSSALSFRWWRRWAC